MVWLAPLAIDLTVIIACIGALVIVLTAKSMADALVHIVRKVAGRLPLIGRLFSAGADYVEQTLVSTLSDVANSLEGVIGAFWHALGNLMASIGHEIYGLAVAVTRMGQYIHGVVRPWVIRTTLGGLTHGLKWLRHELAHAKTQVWRITKVIEHPERTAVGGAVRAITRPLRADLRHFEAWTVAHVKALAHAADVFLPREIGRLGGEVAEIELALHRLRAWVRKHERELGLSALVAPIVWAISKRGGGFIFCRNWKTLGRGVCRADESLIQDLLGATLAIVGTISIIEFAEELQAVVGEGAAAIHGLIREK